MGCYLLLKTTNFLIKCILFNINIKQEQNETIGRKLTKGTNDEDKEFT